MGDVPTQAPIKPFSCHGTVLAFDRTRILLAEDDPEFRRLLALVLSADGHEVEEVADGRELVDWLAERTDAGALDDSCHLIISDSRMPGFSGLDVLSSLHRLGSELPVIMITALGGSAIHRTAASLGAVAIFDKPFDVNDLRTAVLNIVAKAVPHRPAARAATIP